MLQFIVKSSTTPETRLMVDFKVSREAYEKNEITNVGSTHSEKNTADSLTKMKACILL